MDREGRAIGERFDRARIVSGSRASTANYERLVRGADLIHIAAHAIADARSPNLSGIVLGPDRCPQV